MKAKTKVRKADLVRRIEDLERRISSLESRPVTITVSAPPPEPSSTLVVPMITPTGNSMAIST